MNEIPISMFEGMGIVLLVLILYTMIKKALLPSLLSMILAYIMAQSILSGSVVAIIIINDVVSYQPVQSLPIHYLLLGIATIMSVMTFYILIMILNGHVEAMGDDEEKARWAE